MSSTLVANKMTVVHASSGGMVIGAPDVCLTPSPVGPVPIPYPCIGQSSDAAGAAGTVKADGVGVMIASSTFSTSSGDEAGSAGGVMSGKTKGAAAPQLYSMDVKAEGEGVFRLLDIMLANGGPPYNTPPATELQGPAMAVAMGGGSADALDAPRITAVRVAPSSVCCGDEVKIEVEAEHMPKGHRVGLAAVVGSDRRKLPFETHPVLQGDSGEARWAVRRGPAAGDVQVGFRADGLGGPCESSGTIEVKAPADLGPERIEGVLEWPKRVWGHLASGEPELVPTGETGRFRWGYDISLTRGILLVQKTLRVGSDDFKLTPERKGRWQDEIERYWNGRYKLHRADCVRGDRCNCSAGHGCCQWPIMFEVEFEWSDPDPRAIRVLPGARPLTPRVLRPSEKKPPGWSTRLWYDLVGSQPAVRAHEFGHYAGLYDEYGESNAMVEGPVGSRDPKRRYTDMTQGEGIMRDGFQVYPRYFEHIKTWFDDNFGGMVGETKLVRVR